MQTKDLQKKRALRFALMALMIGVAGLAKSYAEHVEPEKAKKVAATFLTNNGNEARSNQLTDLSERAGFPNLYIFNAEQGFVVMAADDRVKPILGYSLTGKFVAENMPENLRWWLQGYNDEIQYAIDNQLRASTEAAQEWEDFAKGRPSVGQRSVVVERLIQTKWNQEYPYNSYCPADSAGSGGYCLAGCMATAMAQIIRYWGHPTVGVGSHSYVPESHPKYGELSVDFGATNYDFSNLAMPDTINTENTEVAKLIYHCGVSVDMDYDIDGSENKTDPMYALLTYFDYDECKALFKIDNQEVWMDTIKSELNHQRPLIYFGDGSSKHIFICDGYDSDNYFHFNWGWGGYCDDFYSLDALLPYSNHDPLQLSGHNFKNNQGAIFGIQPSGQHGCNAPTNLTVSLNGRTATLSWTAAEDVDSYRIYYGYEGELIASNVTGTSFTDYTSLGIGRHYYYVRSNCADGSVSSPSNIIVIEVGLHTITAIANPTSGGMVSGAGAYYENSECTLTAIPNPHYAFTNWTKNGVQVSTDPTYTFTVTEGGTYIANFSLVPQYTITATTNPTQGGWVVGTGIFYAGSTCTLTATASNHYEFVNWKKGNDVVSTNPTYTFTVTESGSYTACFNAMTQYAVTCNSVEHGTVSASPTSAYMGEIITLFSNPDSGYGFSEWDVKDANNHSITVTNNQFIMPDKDITVSAVFTQLQPVIIGDLRYYLNDYTLSAEVRGHIYYNPSGTLTIPSSVTYTNENNQTHTYTVTSIGNSAFRNCNGFTGSLAIPNSVTSIGSYAFDGCSGFTGSLTIPNSVASIGDAAFRNCSGFIGSLTIPNSVTSIGGYSFYGCSGLTCVHYNATNCGGSGNMAFSGCSGTLTIGNNVKSIPDYIFNDCSGFTGSLTIPNSVTSIGMCAFNNCSGFSEVHYNVTNCTSVRIHPFGISPFFGCVGSLTIGNNVERIPDYMFYDCSSFTGSLTIGNSVSSIGHEAFYGCSGFTEVNFDATNCADANIISSDSYSPFFGCGGSLTIGNNVERIPAYMFYNCSGFTDTLIIGNSVTSIGNYAFNGCSGFTGSLTIPNSVTSIGYEAFYNCSGFNGSLTIGNSVALIDSKAFNGCSGFSEINYNATCCADVSYLIISPFSGCDGILTIGDNVERIPSLLFYDCSGLTGELVIPNSVTSIGYQAFSGCSGFTGSLTIPNSVTSIGGSAFDGCAFNGLNIDMVCIPSGFFGYYHENWIEYIGGNFTGSLTIGNSVISIGDYAFSDCIGMNLTSLTIGNSVTSIGNAAFLGCSSFTGSLIIPNSVISIGNAAFEDCSGFTGSLTIPNSVISIGNSAFSGCSGFTGSLTIGNSVTSIGEWAFENCSGFTGSLTIPNSVTSIEKGAFYNCSGFTGSLTISNSVTSIGNYAFYGCSGFTGSLTIGNSVTSIGESAFENCNGFTGSLNIPNSVTSIGWRAFFGCSGFTGSLTIPNSVTSIGATAFENCSGFTGSLTIPNSVTSIRDYTFYNCSGFSGDLTIPNSVTSIGSGAFYGCSGFTGSLSIPNSVTSISNTAFEGCSGFTGSLVIPNSVASIGNYAFYNCSGFTGSLTIGNSVTSIGKEAFWNCSGFSGDLSISNSVTSIGESAFASCSGLSSIHSYGAVPPTTANNAFEGTNYSIPVYVPLCSATDYAEASQWSNFTDYQAVLPCPYTFTGNGTDNLWSNPDNWHTLPANDYDIIINANCEMDEDVEASGVIINNTGTLIIKSGHVLTINGNNNRSGEALVGEIVNHGTAANLIIEDGGQLVYDKSGLQGTVQKAISPYTQNGNDGWHLLAYPLTGNGTVAGQENMLSNDYDLYYYDEPTHYWMNYKDSENGFNQLEAGKGYLYANSGIIPYHGFDQAEYVTNPGAIYGYDASVLQGSQSIYGVNVKHESGYRLGEDFTMLDNATIQSIEVFGYQTGSTTTSTFTGMYIQIYDGNPMEGGQPIWGNMDDNIITATSWTGCYRCNYNLGTTRPIMSIKAENLNIPLEAGTYYLTWNLSGSASSGPWGVPVAIQGVSNTGDGLQYSGDTWNYYLDSGSQMGIGFAFKITWLLEAGTVDDVELSFAGELENGSATINIPLSYTESAGQLKGFNLVGNPFVHNVTNYGSTNVAEGCYRMNETKDNLIVSEIDEENPLKPAESFFVKATDEGASITFNPGRSETASRSGSIRVELLDNDKLIDRLIVKMDGEPLEKMSLKEQRTKLFATQDHQEIAIVPCEGNEQPVNFKAAKNGTYTINVNTNGLEFNYLHLIDNLIGSDVDLLPLCKGGEGGFNEPQQATYTFTAKTSDYASRFKLVFSVCGDADGDDAPFAFISNGNIIVTADAGDASLQVIDMLGRVIRTVGLSQCGSRTTTAGMTKGVYVLRLIEGEKVRTQKIVID